MKILQLIQKPQLRGAEIFACQLSGHLEKLGHEVVVVTLFPGDAELPFTGKFYHLKRPLSKRLYDFAGWKQLAEIIKSEKPDVLQANAGDTLKFAALSKIFNRWNVPIVFRNANKISDFIDSKIKWQLNNFFFSKVDHVVSVSHMCEQDFKKTFRFPSNKICTVPIGINTPDVPDMPPADIQNLFAEGPVLVNVGSLVPEKNHKGLLAVFAKLLESYPAARLIIVGNGRLKDSLTQQCESMGISSRVHFLGYRKDVLAIVRHADVFLMPSFIEGLPGVILEAFYCHTPVVANNVGGIGEVVRNNDTGWLISKGDEEAFGEAVKEAIEDKNKREEFVRNAFKLVNSEYLNTGIAQGFEQVYNNFKKQIKSDRLEKV